MSQRFASEFLALPSEALAVHSKNIRSESLCVDPNAFAPDSNLPPYQYCLSFQVLLRFDALLRPSCLFRCFKYLDTQQLHRGRAEAP